MKEFFAYFFGQGTEVEFSIFTPAHFLPILLMLAVIWLISRFRDVLADERWDTLIRYTLAFTLLISEMSYFWRLVGVPELNPNPVDHLPITVCGWAVVFCSFMIVGKNQSLFDIAYFWLFSGSLFALLTPTVITYAGPTRFRYYQFWLEHTLGYIAIFYMIFVHRMRPTVRSLIRSYTVLLGLAIFAAWINNLIPGANYLYMARPESAPSVLDILPPNYALRTAIIVVCITALFLLAYLPWYLKDKKAKAVAAIQ